MTFYFNKLLQVFHPNSFDPRDSTTSHLWLCSFVRGLIRSLTHFGAFSSWFAFAHASFGLYIIPITSITTTHTWIIMTFMLWSQTSKRQYAFNMWVNISKDVPMTKSIWFHRPLSQSKDDQDNTRDVSQLKQNTTFNDLFELTNTTFVLIHGRILNINYIINYLESGQVRI